MDKANVFERVENRGIYSAERKECRYDGESGG
jgi:hypothetical protein